MEKRPIWRKIFLKVELRRVHRVRFFQVCLWLYLRQQPHLTERQKQDQTLIALQNLEIVIADEELDLKLQEIKERRGLPF